MSAAHASPEMARTAADAGTHARRLNFYMSRYIMVAALSSIMTGLSYVGIIKIKIPEDMQPPHPAWQVTAFYVFACLAMGLSLFNLTVTSFCLVLAQAAVARVPRHAHASVSSPTHPDPRASRFAARPAQSPGLSPSSAISGCPSAPSSNSRSSPSSSQAPHARPTPARSAHCSM